MIIIITISITIIINIIIIIIALIGAFIPIFPKQLNPTQLNSTIDGRNWKWQSREYEPKTIFRFNFICTDKKL